MYTFLFGNNTFVYLSRFLALDCRSSVKKRFSCIAILPIKPFTKSLSEILIKIYFLCDAFFNPKVLILFLFLHENICSGYSLEVPW